MEAILAMSAPRTRPASAAAADPQPSSSPPTAGQDTATPPVAPGTAEGAVAEPSGADGSALTRNQKKKLRKKRKKTAAVTAATASGEYDDEDESGDDGATVDSRATGGDAVLDPSAPWSPIRGHKHADEARVFETWTLDRWRSKLVDFGNACWTYKQFTNDIQTRQYRSPEVMLGQKYSTPVDMWSLACVVFELVTGDLLFDPRDDSKGEYTREEDHLALMIELVGPMPKRMWQSGKYSRDYFNSKGELRHIKKLKFWPMERVLTEKYKLPEVEAYVSLSL